MVESVPKNVEFLLEGKPYEELHEFCDFSLQDQNDASLSKGIQPSAPSEFKPVIKKSVTYIVAAVLLNSEGEVLMMQVGHHKWIHTFPSKNASDLKQNCTVLSR